MSYFGCWEYKGAKSHGYGYVYWPEPGRKCHAQGAHKVAWKLLVGPIPEGYHLHHRCGNPACYNPSHLELVVPREHPGTPHVLRREKTHCIRGHEYTLENTRWSKDARCINGVARKCRTCDREYMRRYNARRRAA